MTESAKAMKRYLGVLLVAVAPQVASGQQEPAVDRDVLFLEKIGRATKQAGSALENARTYVEGRGFTCSPKENAIFTSEFGAGDFLLCERELEKSRIEVALFHKGRQYLRSAMKVRPK